MKELEEERHKRNGSMQSVFAGKETWDIQDYKSR